MNLKHSPKPQNSDQVSLLTNLVTSKEAFDASIPNTEADAETTVISAAGSLGSGFSSEI